VMDTNFWGVVNGTMAFLPHLIASGDGHLVNISSLFGLIPIPTQSAYVASKFAVRGFTESLRIEMLAAKMPVRVTCRRTGCPGCLPPKLAQQDRLAESRRTRLRSHVCAQNVAGVGHASPKPRHRPRQDQIASRSPATFDHTRMWSCQQVARSIANCHRFRWDAYGRAFGRSASGPASGIVDDSGQP
jgi:short-subunit dehydrogenase